MTARYALTAPLACPRVVVVDDDSGVRRALTRLLRVDGYDVRAFGSAEELLDSSALADTDCLVLDVYLGGLTGYDLYGRMARAGPMPPTIFITAYDDAISRGLERLPSGAICLRKPFEETSLVEAIEAVRRRHPPAA